MRELRRRLVEIAPKGALLPKMTGTGIEGIGRELGRHQNGIEPRLGNLPRHLLASG